MPGGDRTGPMGAGRMSGRAAGYCAGNGAPGYASPVPGFGRGWFGRRASARWGAQFPGGFGRSVRGGRGRWPFYGDPFGYGIPHEYVNPYWEQPVPTASETIDQEAERLRQHASYLEQELQSIKGRLDEIEKSKDEE